MRSRSSFTRALGGVACAVGLVGYLAFGWRFDGGGSTVATSLGVLGAVAAVALTLRRGL